MKSKLISYGIVISMLLGAFVIFSPSIVSATPTTVFSDDFESGISNWSNTYPSYIYIANWASHSSSHSLKISSNANSYTETRYITQGYPFQCGIWFKFLGNESFNPSTKVTILQFGDTINLGFQIYDNAGQFELRMKYYNSGWNYQTICNITTPTDWNHLYINYTSYSTVKVFLNDVQHGGDIATYQTNDAVTNFYIAYTEGGTFDGVYVDDFIITTGGDNPTPPFTPWNPHMTNNPLYDATTGFPFTFTPTFNETVTINVLQKPVWMTKTNNTLHGTPNITGLNPVKLRIQSNNGTGNIWVNWSILVVNQTWNPTFTTTPLNHQFKNEYYVYLPECNESVTYSIGSIPSWAHLGNDKISIWGIPDATGNAQFQLKATSIYGNRFVWQNWTVVIYPNRVVTQYLNDTFNSMNNWTAVDGSHNYIANTQSHTSGNSLEISTYGTAGYYSEYNQSLNINYPINISLWFYLDGNHWTGVQELLSFNGFAGASLDMLDNGSTVLIVNRQGAQNLNEIQYSCPHIMDISKSQWHHLQIYLINSSSYYLWMDGAFKNGNGIADSWKGYQGTETLTHLLIGTILYPELTSFFDDLVITNWTNALPTYATTVSGSFITNSHPYYNENRNVNGVLTYSQNGTRIGNQNVFIEVRTNTGTVITSTGTTTDALGRWYYNTTMDDIRASGIPNINGTYHLTAWFEHNGLLSNSNVLNLTLTISPIPIPPTPFHVSGIEISLLILAGAFIFIGIILKWKKNGDLGI